MPRFSNAVAALNDKDASGPTWVSDMLVTRFHDAHTSRSEGLYRLGVATSVMHVDDSIEHEAWNDSDDVRAVMIFDVWNPHLTPHEQELLTRYFAAAGATGFAIPR